MGKEKIRFLLSKSDSPPTTTRLRCDASISPRLLSSHPITYRETVPGLQSVPSHLQNTDMDSNDLRANFFMWLTFRLMRFLSFVDPFQSTFSLSLSSCFYVCIYPLSSSYPSSIVLPSSYVHWNKSTCVNSYYFLCLLRFPNRISYCSWIV